MKTKRVAVSHDSLAEESEWDRQVAVDNCNCPRLVGIVVEVIKLFGVSLARRFSGSRNVFGRQVSAAMACHAISHQRKYRWQFGCCTNHIMAGMNEPLNLINMHIGVDVVRAMGQHKQQCDEASARAHGY